MSEVYHVGKRAGSNIALRRIHCCAEQRIAPGSAFCWQRAVFKRAVFDGALTLPRSGPNHAVLESELFSPTGCSLPPDRGRLADERWEARAEPLALHSEPPVLVTALFPRWVLFS